MQLQSFSGVTGVERLHQLTVHAFADLVIAGSPVASADVLIVAGDTSGEPVDGLYAVCAAVLRAGVSFVCCWGKGCERLHDLFDEAHVARELEADHDSELMTTWHTDESLAEALSFGVHTAWPRTQRTDRQVVVVAVGDTVSAEASAVLTRGAPIVNEA